MYSFTCDQVKDKVNDTGIISRNKDQRAKKKIGQDNGSIPKKKANKQIRILESKIVIGT